MHYRQPSSDVLYKTASLLKQAKPKGISRFINTARFKNTINNIKNRYHSVKQEFEDTAESRAISDFNKIDARYTQSYLKPIQRTPWVDLKKLTTWQLLKHKIKTPFVKAKDNITQHMANRIIDKDLARIAKLRESGHPVPASNIEMMIDYARDRGEYKKVMAEMYLKDLLTSEDTLRKRLVKAYLDDFIDSGAALNTSAALTGAGIAYAGGYLHGKNRDDS